MAEKREKVIETSGNQTTTFSLDPEEENRLGKFKFQIRF